jgi:hypothetical protein
VAEGGEVVEAAAEGSPEEIVRANGRVDDFTLIKFHLKT